MLIREPRCGAIEPMRRIIVVPGCDRGDQVYLMRPGARPAVAPQHGQSHHVLHDSPADRIAPPRPACPDSLYEGLLHKSLLTERTDTLPGPVDRAPTTQSDREGPGMANASDRWPKYRTPWNEWTLAWQVRRPS
jgi:hypothetical protein